MQGAPKRQVNAEDMLAELKRVVEASTHAPSAPPSSAATAPRPSASGPETWRSQIDNGGDRAAKAKAGSSIGQPAHSQKSAGPSSRRWKLTAGGLALAGAAVFAGFALMNQAPDRPAHEFSPPATEGVAQSQDQPALRPMSDLRSPSRPDSGATPANRDSPPAAGKAEVDASHPASSGSAPAAPALPPPTPSSAPVPVPTERIGLDGAPLATAPSRPVSSAPPLAGASKPAAASQAASPGAAPLATAPSAPASADSAPSAPPLAETPKPAAASAASQAARPGAAPLATAPSAPASADISGLSAASCRGAEADGRVASG